MIHLGIDLGTTFSLIGHLKSGRVHLFGDYFEHYKKQTPSVVHIYPDGCLVGQALEDLLEEKPNLPVTRFVKQKIGLVESLFTDHLDRQWTPEAISSLILRKMLKDADSEANEEIGVVVVTIPSNFSATQRRSTKNAAVIAGIHDPVLIEEPVAAATHHGLVQSREEETLFVYDLGGGTFDATILQASPDGLYVIATEGSNNIGGKMFDEAIMDVIATDFKRIHSMDPLLDSAANLQLRRLAEQLKIKLGKPHRGRVQQTILLCGEAYDFLLTRNQFKNLVKPLLDKTIEVCNRCLESASLSWQSIDKILLTGGSTLIPMVKKKMLVASNKTSDKVILKNRIQAVVYGASLIAAQKAGEAPAETPQLMQQISSYELGYRVWDEKLGKSVIEPLIKRNTPLPAKAITTLYTHRPDQRHMEIEIVQTKGQENEIISMDHFIFGTIKGQKHNHPIELSVSYNIEGIVKVSAPRPCLALPPAESPSTI